MDRKVVEFEFYVKITRLGRCYDGSEYLLDHQMAFKSLFDLSDRLRAGVFRIPVVAIVLGGGKIRGEYLVAIVGTCVPEVKSRVHFCRQSVVLAGFRDLVSQTDCGSDAQLGL